MYRVVAWMMDHLPIVVIGLIVGTALLVGGLWWHQAQDDARMIAQGYHQVCVDTGDKTYTTFCSGGKFNICTTTAHPVIHCTWER
jgi:hypothetical protein